MGPNKLSEIVRVATILGQVAKWIKRPPPLLILYAPSSNHALSVNIRGFFGGIAGFAQLLSSLVVCVVYAKVL